MNRRTLISRGIPMLWDIIGLLILWAVFAIAWVVID